MTERFDFPKEEEKILDFWQNLDAFNVSLELSKDRPRFTFYDGPPFATGLPHYGHILAGTIKDIVTRFAYQSGFRVDRRFGWDCHGLPIEFEIDKEYNIKTQADVLAMGIDKYNAACRSIVMRFSSEWEMVVNRMGRWIEFKDDYKTMYPWFMESVWWVFGQLFEKGQIYRGFKVMPFSTGCGTPLSNFEASSNYKEVSDPAVVVAFQLSSDPSVEIIAWTTTPWTLPSNMALCVNPKFNYIKIFDDETQRTFILKDGSLNILYKDPIKAKYKLLEKMKGSELVGLSYMPLFNYISTNDFLNAFTILGDDYVTEEGGTGVVHNAPGHGEDDFRVCIKAGIITAENVPCFLDSAGKFTSAVSDFDGVYVKDADKDIIKFLKTKNRILRHSTLLHQYPFCWRSETPLIYMAVPSWFVRVTNIIPDLLRTNAMSRWVPDFVQEKRFKNWLESARDWAISRNRFWGTPIPIWASDDLEEIVCISSIQQLEELTGVAPITDLHRDSIDHLTIPSKQGKGLLRRVPEVLDCWFESGSVPYAQSHYPFENSDLFEKGFPSDFIGEGLDQTRGWFYTLFVISTHLFGTAPFKNVIVNGLILAADGKKMSKRLKNYPEPSIIFNEYGADALRLYLINSPVVRAEPLRFKEEGVKGILRDVLIPWQNVCKFLHSQIIAYEKNSSQAFFWLPEDVAIADNTMDKWILASLNSLIAFFNEEMKNFRLYTVVPRLLKFVEELTNWYVRLNRRRLKGEFGDEETLKSLNCLFEVCFDLSRLMCPFTPFITEIMYQSMKPFMKGEIDNRVSDHRSIHFLLLPKVKAAYENPEILIAFSRLQRVVELTRSVRESKNIGLKMPLRELVVIVQDEKAAKDLKDLEYYILDELNIRSLTISTDEAKFPIKYKVLPNFAALGKRLKADIGKVKEALAAFSTEDARKYLKEGQILVHGHILSGSDIEVIRYAEALDSFEAKFDEENVVLLDTFIDLKLKEEAFARELINRVNRLRKKCGLKPTDDVKVCYQLMQDPNNEFQTAIRNQNDLILKSLKRDLEGVDSAVSNVSDALITVEETMIGDAQMMLQLLRL